MKHVEARRIQPFDTHLELEHVVTLLASPFTLKKILQDWSL